MLHVALIAAAAGNRDSSRTLRHQHAPSMPPSSVLDEHPVNEDNNVEDLFGSPQLRHLLKDIGLDSRFGAYPFDASEIGLTAKFEDGRPDQTKRWFVCTHRCANEVRCPNLGDRAAVMQRVLLPMQPPPLVQSWLRVLETELRDRPEQLPQICIGAADGAGKLYVGAMHRGGVGTFPDLPLACVIPIRTRAPCLARALIDGSRRGLRHHAAKGCAFESRSRRRLLAVSYAR